MLAVIWFAGGVLLAIAELFTLDFVLIMLAAGAFAAAGTALGFGVLAQVIVFAVVSSLGLLLVRPALKHRLHRNAEPAVMGVAAIEGSAATVVETVGEGRGMVKIGGELWQARPFDGSQTIEAGAEVRVVEVSGATALVWRE